MSQKNNRIFMPVNLQVNYIYAIILLQIMLCYLIKLIIIILMSP